MLRIVVLLMAAALSAGCATAPEPAPVQEPPRGGASVLPLTDALYAQHREWEGVPYRLGGMSKRGVDCSGFVHTTFRSQFGVELPRTTESQLGIGRSVDRDGLQSGDLVFFRTGNGKRHVGIYVENRTFLHASTSQGVTLSSLDNPYWASAYWQARRVALSH